MIVWLPALLHEFPRLSIFDFLIKFLLEIFV